MKFSQEELDFIRRELGIEAREEEEDAEILGRIWEEACEIEIAESNQHQVLTEKGNMAVRLVTRLGEK